MFSVWRVGVLGGPCVVICRILGPLLSHKKAAQRVVVILFLALLGNVRQGTVVSEILLQPYSHSVLSLLKIHNPKP